LDDKAKILSYEHYCPYGGTAIIAGKDKTQVQQKYYRYTGVVSLALCLLARFNHSADSFALVIINIVLCGFVCFGEFVKGIVVIPISQLRALLPLWRHCHYRWQRQSPSAAKILSLHRQRKR
jgi:CHASE2 domain-containing sensor protein